MTRSGSGGNRWWLVIAAGLAVFVAQADVTVVHIAIPTLQRQFDAGAGATQWVVLAYVLPLVGLSLSAGRWVDRMGRREAMVASLLGFAAASAAVGLAPTLAWVIAARALQGVFGAVLFALIPVLATTAVNPAARGRAMAVVTVLGPVGALSGPVIAGPLIDHAGWPWIFYINVPVCLLVAGIVRGQLAPGGWPRLPDRGWFAETGLLSAAAVAVVLALSLTATAGPAWGALAVAAVPFLLLWRRLPGSAEVLRLLGSPGMRGPHLALLAEMTAVIAIQFLIPSFLQGVIGTTATTAGLTMVAFPAGVVAGGLAGGVLTDRWAARPVALLGAAMVTAGTVLLVPLGEAWGPGDLMWRLALVGVGAGLFTGQNQTMAMAQAPPHLLATTGASTSLARQTGLALGPAVATVTWSLVEGSDGMRLTLGVAAVLGAASVAALAGRRTTAARPHRAPSVGGEAG